MFGSRSVLVAISTCVWLLALTGCPIHKYHPAPVSTADTLAAYESRSLSTDDLRDFIRTNAHGDVSDWPWHAWDVERLTLAAYFYSPDLDLARANLASAQAAVVTAGARPNPSVGLAAGYESTPDSPYLWNIDFALPIETAGKRGYRVLEAKQSTGAVRISLAETAWQVRMKVRSALLAYLNAQKQVDALKREEEARVAKLHLLESRLNAGEIARPEVTVARLDVFNLRLTLRVEGLRSPD
jgi:hypothetical protein